MLYNTTWKFTKVIDPPTQEEIYNCPHYFGMSYEQVRDSGPPEFLMKLLDQFPFDGRKTILQIRPQDFRNGPIGIDGIEWHSDYNVRLLDGKHYAKDHDEFHLMVISWGYGPKTEFLTTPMHLPNNLVDYDKWKSEFELRCRFSTLNVVQAPKNQMVEYKSSDLHKAGSWKHGDGPGFRLMVVGFDTSYIDGNIRILPSIRENDREDGIPLWKETEERKPSL
jgi:hypothetical protein